MGTEESGVDEAGLATEPSLMVAPSGRDIDPEEETAEATVDNEVMSSSRTRSKSSGSDAARSGAKAAQATKDDLENSAGSAPDDAGKADADASERTAARSQSPVPFPADEIGKPKSSSLDSPDDDGQPDGAASPNSMLVRGS